MVGYTSAVMFVSEAVMMALSKPMLKRMRPLQMVMLSSGFFALWQLLCSLMPHPWQVAACAVLDGPAFALLGIGVLYYIDEPAPKEMRSTCQAVAYACYFGISGVPGNAAGGWILPHTGYRGMYLRGFLLILLAHLLFVGGSRLRFFSGEQ